MPLYLVQNNTVIGVVEGGSPEPDTLPDGFSMHLGPGGKVADVYWDTQDNLVKLKPAPPSPDARWNDQSKQWEVIADEKIVETLWDKLLNEIDDTQFYSIAYQMAGTSLAVNRDVLAITTVLSKTHNLVRLQTLLNSLISECNTATPGTFSSQAIASFADWLTQGGFNLSASVSGDVISLTIAQTN